MTFDFLFTEHLFEFLNFVFLCGCFTHLYRKYGAPVLAQAMQEKQAVRQALKQSVTSTQQQVGQVEQEIMDQETYGTSLVTHIKKWAQKEEQKKHHNEQERLLLQQEFVAYLVSQDKAVSLIEIQKDIVPHALSSARQRLIERYQNSEQQHRAIAYACNHFAKVPSDG